MKMMSVSDEGKECFTSRLLQRVTVCASGSFAGFLGRGLVGEVGGA